MKITVESKAWAMTKLLAFRDWWNFPSNEEDLDGAVRSFLRLVHHKPIREIMTAACLPGTTIDWDRKGFDPEQDDAEWILDLIRETMDRFPKPVQMREMYEAVLPPASTLGGTAPCVGGRLSGPASVFPEAE